MLSVLTALQFRPLQSTSPPKNHFVFGYDLPIRNLLQHILKTLDPQHDVSGRVFTL